MFIVIEGCDGTGKTTQTEMLRDWFVEQKRACLLIQEPGTTQLGRELRKLLKDASMPMQPLTQTLLFAAARAETSKLIAEHLSLGGVVIADRWHLSTLVYQGEVQGVPLSTVMAILSMADLNLRPDLTVLLDIDPAIAAKRRAAEGTDVTKDRFEAEGLVFQQRLRKAYLDLSVHVPNLEIMHVDHCSKTSLHNEILGNVDSFLRDR